REQATGTRGRGLMTVARGAATPGADRGRAGPGTIEGALSLQALLVAIPVACAALEQVSGGLVAGNRRYHDQFGPAPGQVSLERLMRGLHPGSTGGAGVERDGRRDVRVPHSGRWYSLHWGRVEDAGQPLDLLSAVDISERIEVLDSHKSQQEQLLFTSRLMSVGEMAATLAHELNQPLAAIVNYLNGSLRLVGQTGGPVQVERALQAARTQAEHASAVIARVREFVRAREPRRSAHRLGPIADTVLELLRLEAERQQLCI